jgi:hypothetical protein
MDSGVPPVLDGRAFLTVDTIIYGKRPQEVPSWKGFGNRKSDERGHLKSESGNLRLDKPETRASNTWSDWRLLISDLVRQAKLGLSRKLKGACP